MDAIETKYFQIGGELVRKDLVAYGERRAAVELCLKVMRVMPAARHEVQVTIEELLTESWVDDKKPAEP